MAPPESWRGEQREMEPSTATAGLGRRVGERGRVGLRGGEGVRGNRSGESGDGVKASGWGEEKGGRRGESR
eukprot:2939103-Pleurochrysis_carterae.AAC.1